MARQTRRSTAAAAEATTSRDDVPEDPPSSPQAENGGDKIGDAGSQETASKLRFNKTLLGRPGRQIPLAELTKRLSSLGQELQNIDQEETNDETLAALAGVGKELSDTQLVSHKDKGVKAWVAWCAVDLLRLCAPNAPFSQKQLKAIFEMIVKSIFPLLSDPSHAYYEQCLYVLRSLAEVKSIVLITETPGSEALISQIFVTFFDTLSGSSKASDGEQIPKAVHYHMTALLVILVDEAQVMPQEAVDILIAQFLRVDPRTLSVGEKSKKSTTDPAQSTLSMKEFPPAYVAAKSICISCPEKMMQEISKYFNDVILDASKSNNRRELIDPDDLDISMAELDDSQLAELEKAHRLLRELWRACPFVLQNVIPQLEHELGTENVHLRVLATETLGDIISGIGAAGLAPPPTVDPAAYPPPDLTTSENPKNDNLLTKPASPQSFSQAHSRTYSAFLGRKQDKSFLVRAAWAAAIGRILATNAGGTGLSREEEDRLAEDLARMLNDSDERVRVAAVKTIGNFSLKELINKLGNSGSVEKTGSVLNNLGERIKDKKSSVRIEAMQIFSSIWALAYGGMLNGDERLTELLGGIPSKVLNCYYTNDNEITGLMDRALYNTLLPLNYPPIKSKSIKSNGAAQPTNGEFTGTNEVSATNTDPDRIRAERVLFLAKHLDERATKVFLALPNRQRSVNNCIRAYLEWCEKYNGGVMDTNEATINDRLIRIIGETVKLLPDPVKAKADLLKFAKAHDRRAYQLMRFSSDPKSDYKTVHNAIKEFSKRIDSSLKETLIPLLHRMAILIFNRSHIPTYLDASKSGDKALSDITHKMLDGISRCMPSVASTKVNELYARIIQLQPSSKQENSFEAASDLRTCANFAKHMPDNMPQGRDLDEAIKAYIQFGSPPDTGKYAVAIGMAQAENRTSIGRILKEHSTKAYKYGQQGFLSRLAALSQLALLSPPTKAGMADFFLDIALDQTLNADPITPNLKTEGYFWSDQVDDDAVAKCWAVRVATNRIRCHRDSDPLIQLAQPILKILIDIVEREGDVGGRGNMSAVGKPRIRLQAAKSLLKLCKIKAFDSLFTAQHFHKLAEVALDPVFEVRRAFLTKLERYLNDGALTPRFYTIFFLVAYEPNSAFKLDAVKWIRSRTAFFASRKSDSVNEDKKPTRKSTTLESIIQRLLSLLAHFSDYGDTPAELGELAVYIVFYLSTVANAENISYIYHIAQRIKSARDAVSARTGEDGIDFTGRLHVLSDLASYAIRSYADLQSWTLQSLPGRVPLSAQLYSQISNHLDATDIAAKNFLSPDTEILVDSLVQWSKRKGGQGILNLPQALISKKRKNEVDGSELSVKKARNDSLPVREKSSTKAKKHVRRQRHGSDDDGSDDENANDLTPSRSAENANRRKSGRFGGIQVEKSYRERDDSEDDEEMEQANEASTGASENGDENEDEHESEAEAASEPSDTEIQDANKEAEQLPTPSAIRSKTRSTRGGGSSSSVAPSPAKTPAETSAKQSASTKSKAKLKSPDPAPSSSPVATSGERRSTRLRR
ncbi:MAG: hypothetical protein GOMPHAMPRED_003144 [Gomphillus americanus]|uniref:Uncharacterized protein n=1 Tax=Gomphillus americanus TaxID=1940652 RepID=A0A8H3EF45_9LECA|nr:MAG: hypothetical protein GOMPHAMPRED_003144 [Gomphillus americanus]